MNPLAKHQTSIDHERRILKLAITSRLLILSLIVFWRSVVDPYDTSSSLNPDCLVDNDHVNAEQNVLICPRISFAIENSIVWDSVYVVRIAQCGYEYEQTYAFLPLLPICILILSKTVFAPLVPLVGIRAVLALAGYVVNNVTFVLVAIFFYRLSASILKDSNTAFRASILFCFNPASIFYSSIYSETLYSLFSLGGLYYLLSGADNTAVLWFCLSGCARSNGVLNAGYFCFQTMQEAYNALLLKKRAALALRVLIVGAFRCTCIFAPFIIFQAYGYYNMCHGRSQEEMRPWCKRRVPVLYNYIQSHYWNVGFLRYFQLKQLPNFLLASPILYLAFSSIHHYMKSQAELFLSLGFRASTEVKMSRSERACFEQKFSNTVQDNSNLRLRKRMMVGDGHGALAKDFDVMKKPTNFSTFIVPCTLHLGFMAATAFFIMHVQVSTRFLSASPPLYWFASYIMASGTASGRRWGYIIWSYCISYILLGSLLFSNFYPFT